MRALLAVQVADHVVDTLMIAEFLEKWPDVTAAICDDGNFGMPDAETPENLPDGDRLVLVPSSSGIYPFCCD